MLLLVVLFVIMYLMLIRPENKRKKKIENMRNALRKGDTVYTIGGVIGKVVALDDEKLTIETSEDRVRLEFAKWAISTNETAAEAQKAEAKKAQEARAKAKAAKKAEKDNK